MTTIRNLRDKMIAANRHCAGSGILKDAMANGFLVTDPDQIEKISQGIAAAEKWAHLFRAPKGVSQPAHAQ